MRANRDVVRGDPGVLGGTSVSVGTRGPVTPPFDRLEAGVRASLPFQRASAGLPAWCAIRCRTRGAGAGVPVLGSKPRRPSTQTALAFSLAPGGLSRPVGPGFLLRQEASVFTKATADKSRDEEEWHPVGVQVHGPG